MREDIFVLIIGHGRGGTSAVWGFIDSFSGMNIGREQNQNFFKKDVRLRSNIGFELSKEFNGNKVILADREMVTLADIIFCIENKKGIIHDRFKELKPVFVIRDPIDNLCSKYIRGKNSGKPKYNDFTPDIVVDNWIYNNKVINGLIEYLKGNYFIFDFYDFIGQKEVRKKLLDWIGIIHTEEDLDKEVSAGIYGTNFLDLKVMHFGPNYRKKFMVERKEIENLLIDRLGNDWRRVIPRSQEKLCLGK